MLYLRSLVPNDFGMWTLSHLPDGLSAEPVLGGGHMKKRTYCVYNQTRECFLSLTVTAADTIVSRLKGFIGRRTLRSDEGLWVVPSRGVHTWGVLVPIDLIYLDAEMQVIHLVEHFPAFRVAPIRARAESVLEMPIHTIYSSQTQLGDQFVICIPDEMEHRLRSGAVKLQQQC